MAVSQFRVIGDDIHGMTATFFCSEATDVTPAIRLGGHGYIYGSIVSRIVPPATGTYSYNIEASGDGVAWVVIQTHNQGSLPAIAVGNLAAANYLRVAMSAISTNPAGSNLAFLLKVGR